MICTSTQTVVYIISCVWIEAYSIFSAHWRKASSSSFGIFVADSTDALTWQFARKPMLCACMIGNLRQSNKCEKNRIQHNSITLKLFLSTTSSSTRNLPGVAKRYTLNNSTIGLHHLTKKLILTSTYRDTPVNCIV